MEVEERPTKIRRLSYPANTSNELRTVPGKSTREGNHSMLEQKRTLIAEVNHEDESAASSDEGGILLEDSENGQVNAAASSGMIAPAAGSALSKNQLKKLKRKQDWEDGRAFRKAKRKEKIKEKKQHKRDATKNEVDPAPAQSPAEPPSSNVKHENGIVETPKQRHVRTVQLPITFIFDCGFDELMSEKERISLASQLTRCYSDNYRAPFRAHLAVSSFGGQLKQRFDTVLSGQHQSWKGVKFLAEDFVEAAEQAKVWMTGDQGGILKGSFAAYTTGDQIVDSGETETVYLSSDSPDTLTELKPYSTYIIGGLVDKNRHKGICYKRALGRGMKTARLPIGEYMEMTTRSVLATNHVSEIMLRWLELNDWGEAFLKVVPKRKGGVMKSSHDRFQDELHDDERETRCGLGKEEYNLDKSIKSAAISNR